jgi:hypothetical protein
MICSIVPGESLLQQKGPYFVVVPALTAIGAFSGSLAGTAMLAIGAGMGFAWGVLVGRIAGLVRRRLTGSDQWATRSIATAAFLMSLYAESSAPESMLALMRPPLKGGFTFFVVFNTLLEWIAIPLAVFMNWHLPRRRRLMVAGALLYYGARGWSYGYFVPRILEFMALPIEGGLSDELAEAVATWVQLSWIRAAVDGGVAIMFLFAVSEGPRVGPDGHAG